METHDSTNAENARAVDRRLIYGDYDDNGVDLSLLRHMLGLSPLERLILMEQQARETRILHEYGRRHREAQAAADR